MALPSSACGGSLPAPGTAAALQTRPVGWRWLEESSAHRKVLWPLSCRARSHLPCPSSAAAVTPCLCSGLQRDVFAAPRVSIPARRLVRRRRIHSCWWEGEGGKLQPNLCSSLGWVRCPMMGTVWVTLLDPPGECLLCFPIPRDGSWGAVPRGGGS